MSALSRVRWYPPPVLVDAVWELLSLCSFCECHLHVGLQIHNALGFAYLQMERLDFAINNFGKAVELQPGYTIAWNNLGDAYERVRHLLRSACALFI